MRRIVLSDILTKREIAAAQKLYKKSPPGTFAQKCADEIIFPVIDKIDKKLGGQRNDPLFIAYVCEYVFNETGSRTSLCETPA